MTVDNFDHVERIGTTTRERDDWAGGEGSEREPAMDSGQIGVRGVFRDVSGAISMLPSSLATTVQLEGVEFDVSAKQM